MVKTRQARKKKKVANKGTVSLPLCGSTQVDITGACVLEMLKSSVRVRTLPHRGAMWVGVSGAHMARLSKSPA